MKYTKSIYFILTFTITLLTYQQHFGLNALLIPLLLSLAHYFLYKNEINARWLLAAFLWICSGLGIFLWHLDIGIPLFIISGFHYFSVSFNQNISLPFSLLQTLISFFTGIGRFFMIKTKAIQISTINDGSKKLIRKFLLIVIPLVIFIIFLRLYQSANVEFAELTAFINLNFIELPFFIYFSLLSVFAFGLFFFKPNQKLSELDVNRLNDLEANDYDDITTSEKSAFEWQIGLILVSSLSILLLAFIIVDFQTVMGKINSELSHSQGVHQSINILIGSIIMVIVIVIYLFRGSLNFHKSKILPVITICWLVLNAAVVLLIFAKNSQYISEWGLTHKRVGVYVYSILCLIGLSFTLYKIHSKNTTSFLVERTSITFLSALVIFGLVNWNSMITSYNLNPKNLSTEKIDFYYMSNLGPEVYPQLIDYIQAHPNCNQNIDELMGYSITSIKMSYTENWTDIFSYTYSGYRTFKALENYESSNFRHQTFYF